MCLAEKEPIAGIEQITCSLHDPLLVGAVGDARDGRRAGFEVDDNHYVVADESMPGQCFDGEEVGGSDRAPMRLQESTPGGPLGAGGGWVDGSFSEPPGNRGPADLDTEVLECPDNAEVAPGFIFLRHLQS